MLPTSSILSLALLALLSLPAPAHAASPQPSDGEDRPANKSRDADGESPDEDERLFDRPHREQLYEEGRLRYSKAALLTLALPGLGNFYAQQPFIGGLAIGLMGFAGVLVPYGLVTDQPVMIWTGLGTAGAAYGTGLISTYFGVRRYNHKLRRQLRITGRTAEPPTPIGPVVGFRF